jgi:hypothetical protein
MEEALRFFKLYEMWIYLLLGVVGLYFATKFARAWNELRQSAFGLERESAQNRLNRAASALVLVVMAAIVEFGLVSFIVPAVPEANPLLTPTLNLLVTPTTTLPAEGAPAAQGTNPAPAGNLQSPDQAGCVPAQVFISEPQNGSTIQGIVPITGTANVPNFGYYKFEMARPDDPNWLSIEARNSPVEDGQLGNWNTSIVDPGLYQLRLVVTDNTGQALPACVIEVNVIAP